MMGEQRSGTEADQPADGTQTTHQLYAEFELTMLPSASCPLVSFDSDVRDVRQQVIGEECRLDVTVSQTENQNRNNGRENENTNTTTQIVRSSATLDSHCHCAVFHAFECIPQITAVDGRTMSVETHLPDRSRLTGLVDALKSVTESVSLRRLIRVGEHEGTQEPTVTLDLHAVTDKQREAATRAVAAGYYQTPRAVTIGELAADLEISKSAMSQRLTAVESKLAVTAFR